MVQIGRESDYFYKVLNRVNGVEGFVLLSQRRLDDFRESSLLWKELTGSFENNEEIVDIDIFAPHGEDEPDPAFIKRGVGTYVLDRVIADMIKERKRIAYSHEPSPSAYCLFMKNGFQELSNEKQREVFRRLNYYRLSNARRTAAYL